MPLKTNSKANYFERWREAHNFLRSRFRHVPSCFSTSVNMLLQNHHGSCMQAEAKANVVAQFSFSACTTSLGSFLATGTLRGPGLLRLHLPAYHRHLQMMLGHVEQNMNFLDQRRRRKTRERRAYMLLFNPFHVIHDRSLICNDLYTALT